MSVTTNTPAILGSTYDDRADRAADLDGPGAIVSHDEVLSVWLAGERRPCEVADRLAVSPSTASRLLRNLRRAGII